MQEIKHLLSILETVNRYGDSEAAEWFDSGCHEYMTGSKKKTLDKCLSLGSSTGIPLMRTQYMKARRNEFIRLAFELTDPDKCDTTRRDILLDHIRYFERTVYPRWKKDGVPQKQCSELWFYLYQAKETGQKLALDTRYILYLVNGY